MPPRSLLVMVGPSTDGATLKPLMHRAHEDGLHVAVLVAGLSPAAPAFAYGIDDFGTGALTANWKADLDIARAAADEAVQRFRAVLSDASVGGTVAAVEADASTVERIVARTALTVDAMLVSDDLREDRGLFDTLVTTGLFDTPSGIVLNAVGSPAALSPARVFVAWNGGLPAARALRAALPWLSDGTEITLGLFDPVTTEARDGANPGSDVARWLNHLGFRVEIRDYPSGGEELSGCITRRAAEIGADLIVAGAYGHSRLRQLVFGGTTRDLLAQKDMPILLAH